MEQHRSSKKSNQNKNQEKKKDANIDNERCKVILETGVKYSMRVPSGRLCKRQCKDSNRSEERIENEVGVKRRGFRGGVKIREDEVKN